MNVPKRSLNKWHRLAYELEQDASRMRLIKQEYLAQSLKYASQIIGDAVRKVEG